MQMQSFTLINLVREPKIKTDKAPLLLMLHGYGSNERDLFSFADELPPELLIVSARAPIEVDYNAYAWYSIRFNADSANFSDIPEAKRALKMIGTFLDEILDHYNIDENNIFFMGFSQGTILSTAFALNNPEKVRHVVALSGYVNTELLDDDLSGKDHSGLDFFVSHGSVDQIIPVEWARKTPGFLDKLGIANEYHEYPVGHGVAPQNFHDMEKWISDRI
jgi:phospholipase/carboxylesterase